jgi:hypothetical protein
LIAAVSGQWGPRVVEEPPDSFAFMGIGIPIALRPVATFAAAPSATALAVPPSLSTLISPPTNEAL